jgi:hypothetical protein
MSVLFSWLVQLKCAVQSHCIIFNMMKEAITWQKQKQKTECQHGPILDIWYDPLIAQIANRQIFICLHPYLHNQTHNCMILLAKMGLPKKRFIQIYLRNFHFYLYTKVILPGLYPTGTWGHDGTGVSGWMVRPPDVPDGQHCLSNLFRFGTLSLGYLFRCQAIWTGLLLHL